MCQVFNQRRVVESSYETMDGGQLPLRGLVLLPQPLTPTASSTDWEEKRREEVGWGGCNYVDLISGQLYLSSLHCTPSVYISLPSPPTKCPCMPFVSISPSFRAVLSFSCSTLSGLSQRERYIYICTYISFSLYSLYSKLVSFLRSYSVY